MTQDGSWVLEPVDPDYGSLGLIAAERQRQLQEEDWDHDHDDEHIGQELAWAATCYAAPAGITLHDVDPWPWDEEWDKRTKALPADSPLWAVYGQHAPRVRNLTKAGALIAAEMDRLRRARERGLLWTRAAA